MRPGFLAFGLLLACLLPAEADDAAVMYPKLRSYISESVKQFDKIPAERKQLLKKIAGFVRERTSAGRLTNLTFICTHNSRRSHLSQIWAQTAAAYYGLHHVSAYSGGTESTAFNPRAVEAVRRAGFHVAKTTEGENPVYHVRFGQASHPITNFSKVYDAAPNPSKDFCAVMTCGSADRSCPFVRGATLRVAIPYEDPKAFDGTKREAAAYDERCRQISREQLYLFSLVGGESTASVGGRG